MLWKKPKPEKKKYPIPENDLIKVNREQLEKIQQALDELNKELISRNNEKLSVAKAIY